MSRPLIEPGRCSACHAPAERGRSGAWWHARGAACGRDTATFEPLDDDSAERHQQASPRNRQITDPGRDR